MAATLTRDSVLARTADVPLAPSAFDGPEPTSVTEAVFRLIADGRPRPFDEIARIVLRRAGPDAVRTVVDEIERLRGHGMRIRVDAGIVDAVPVAPLERADIVRELARNGDHADGAPWQARVVFATRSTNADLLAAVRVSPPAGPLLLAAELQTAGRGRLGRRWASAPGASLTISFALTVERRLARLDGVTLACGLAVHEILDGIGVQTRLKWPNDVLVGGAKIAGILVEAHPAGEATILVIGIGLNVAAAGEPSREPSALPRTSLDEARAITVDRNVVAARLASVLERTLALFAREGFGAFTARWNAVDAFSGRGVALDATLGGRRTGIARGVDDRGALLVEIDGGVQRIVAGDVSLRPTTAIAGNAG